MIYVTFVKRCECLKRKLVIWLIEDYELKMELPMKKLILVSVAIACCVGQPSFGADLSKNFTVSAYLVCSDGNKFPRTARRLGNHIFAAGTIANSGATFIVNSTVDIWQPGIMPSGNAKILDRSTTGSNSSEVSSNSVTMRENHNIRGTSFETTTRIIVSGDACEYTVVTTGLKETSCRATRCSAKN